MCDAAIASLQRWIAPGYARHCFLGWQRGGFLGWHCVGFSGYSTVCRRMDFMSIITAFAAPYLLQACALPCLFRLLRCIMDVVTGDVVYCVLLVGQEKYEVMQYRMR